MIAKPGDSVVVLGNTGFIGRHVQDELRRRGFRTTPVNYIVETENDVSALVGYDHIINCAGWNGGIKFNQLYPDRIYYENTMVPLVLFYTLKSMEFKGRVISMMASCAYDGEKDEIPQEANPLDGKPNDSVACHGYAKRNAYLMANYVKPALDVGLICPGTVYGPGDKLDPDRTKVMMSLIKKFVDATKAGDEIVTIWGSGLPIREFIYVKDLAKEIVDHLELDRFPLLTQVPGYSSSIKELAERIASIVGYTGKILFDTTRPDGQMKKRFTHTNYSYDKYFKGLMETIRWYENLVS